MQMGSLLLSSFITTVCPLEGRLFDFLLIPAMAELLSKNADATEVFLGRRTPGSSFSDPSGPVGDLTNPVGDVTGPVGKLTQPTGDPIGPLGDLTESMSHLTGPTGDPGQRLDDPTGPADDPGQAESLSRDATDWISSLGPSTSGSQSIADMVRSACEEINTDLMHGFRFDPATNWYYNENTGYFWQPVFFARQPHSSQKIFYFIPQGIYFEF